MKKNIISINFFIPVLFFLVFIFIFVKVYYIDMRSVIENEIKFIKKQLLLDASKHQLTFSYILSRQDHNEIEKVLSIFSLDKQHYELMMILDEDMKQVYPQNFLISHKNKKDLNHEIKAHDLKGLLKKKKLLVEYDLKEGFRHFDVAIPLEDTSNIDGIRSAKQYMLYFHYNPSKEIKEIKKFFIGEITSTFLILIILLIIAIYVNYVMNVKKVKKLAELSKSYAKNDFSKRASLSGFKELRELAYALNNMADQIYENYKLINDKNYELKNKTLEMLKFQRAVEQSSFIVMMTNVEGIIEYVNPAVLKETGYEADELIGKKPKIFRSGVHDKEFYDNLWEVIRKNDIWKGRLVNKIKDEKEIILDAQIFPLLDENNNVTHYISIQNNITKVIEQQNAMAFQSKQAQMGEMLSMIAHQWRQPLASIGATVTTIEVETQLGELNIEELSKELKKISNIVEYLSETINDFSDFYKPNNETKFTSFDTIVKKCMSIIENILTSSAVKVSIETDDTMFKTYESELVQVVLNLLKNTLDIFKERTDILNREIKISVEKDDNNITLVYQDSAGGCKVEPLENIFAPYFTTKNELQGTGLGLYMSKTIIEEHCNGKIYASNIKDGIEFRIQLPL